MSKPCPACGKEIPGTINFCEECGADLRTHNTGPDLSPEPSGTPRSPAGVPAAPPADAGAAPAAGVPGPAPVTIPSLSTLAVIGVCIVLLIACLVVIPTRTATYTVEVAYTGTETYYEKEPYVMQESYQEQEPYQTTETYTDTVPVPVSVPFQDYEYSYKNYDAGAGKYFGSVPTGCSCSATQNMNDQDGVFGPLCVQLNCLVANPVTGYRTEMQQQSIEKERPVTKYQAVTKIRNVTRYQDVAKTRDVMKTRNETRSSEVNWLLGFKVPYSLHLPFG